MTAPITGLVTTTQSGSLYVAPGGAIITDITAAIKSLP